MSGCDPKTHTWRSVGGVRTWYDLAGNPITDAGVIATLEAALTADTNCAKRDLRPTGIIKCYPSGAATEVQYVNDDNTTDITASSNATTLKWQISLGQETDADSTGPAIADCIAAGGQATITYTYVEPNNGFSSASFLATAVISTAPDWAFSGNAITGSGSSGKLVSATVTCSVNTGSGKAIQFFDCDAGQYVWLDCLDATIEIDPSTLEDCPCCKCCDTFCGNRWVDCDNNCINWSCK